MQFNTYTGSLDSSAETISPGLFGLWFKFIPDHSRPGPYHDISKLVDFETVLKWKALRDPKIWKPKEKAEC